MSLPPELTVTIEQIGDDPDGGARYLSKLLRASDEEISRTTFTFREDLLVDLEPQWLLDRAVPRGASQGLTRGELTPAQAKQVRKLVTYGQRLYRFLFGDGSELEAFCRYNDAYRSQARLTLALHGNAARLWRLPWEYLHDGEAFLALNGRFLLSRRPYGLANLRPGTVPLPLRLLVVISAPDDQPPLDTEEEIGVIQEALDEAVRSGRVTVEYLDDATLPAIGAALRRVRPHVIHYTGHGVFKADAGRSFLALERDDGRGELADIDDLKPYLADVRGDLRLVLLSACQSARTGSADAFGGVATGLLDEDVPAVLAMQFSILDNSAIQMARAFYAALAEGRTPAEATQRARVALRDFDAGPGYDWGVPALYLRAQGMRLVDPEAEVPESVVPDRVWVDVGGLPLPPHFVGRKPQLRTLRQALRERSTTAVFVRGIGGMGKSSLAAKLIERPGADVDGVCVIRCDQVDPLDIPKKLADFLAAQGKAGHAEAAALLLDSRHDPCERARKAALRVAERRYLLVFDNFESLQASAGKGQVEDDVLRGLLRGLAAARWRSLCLFTGRFRWDGIDAALGRGTAEEIHLPELSTRQAIMLMNNLPRLRAEPLDTKIALYRKVGGHPKSLELLNGWLASGRVSDLLTDPALDELLREEWEDYFLRALLARLTPDERQALTRLSVFRTPLDEEEFDYAEVERATVTRWLDLSLVQREKGAAPPALPPEMAALLDMLPPAERAKFERVERFTVHPVVRDYLLGGLEEEARRDLHAWAADYYGRPFVEIARQALTQSGVQVTEAEIAELARDRDGVVGQMVRQTKDMAQARGAMGRALEWHHHLFQARAYDPADDIVNAVWGVLDRWGERDRAKALLRGSIATLEGFARAVAQGNLASLLVDEGKLDEALATYEAVYRTFEEADSQANMAVALNMQSQVLQAIGRTDKAIAKQEASLEIMREIENEEGQAISLHQLSMLYHLKGALEEALARSRAAEALARKLGLEHGVAKCLHEQGLILNRMTLEQAAASLETEEAPQALAFERFQESLKISRRIGNEAGAADSLGELGKLLRDDGQYQEAIEAFNEVLDITTRLGDPVKTGIAIEILGSIHERQGQLAAALEKYREALALYEQYAPPEVERCKRNIARVEAKLGGGT